MPANRKRLAIWAPEDRWQLLGELLAEWRRIRLGLGTMVAFARECLPLTPDGNPNRRRVDDLENNRRPNRWPEPTLKEMAAAYGVTYQSMRDVLDGKTDKLDPAAPARRPALPPAPDPGLLREGGVRPYATLIWEALWRAAARGNLDPSGAQLGLPPEDARVWDAIGRDAMSLADRAWLTGDIRRRREERRAGSEPDADSA